MGGGDGGGSREGGGCAQNRARASLPPRKSGGDVLSGKYGCEEVHPPRHAWKTYQDMSGADTNKVRPQTADVAQERCEEPALQRTPSGRCATWPTSSYMERCCSYSRSCRRILMNSIGVVINSQKNIHQGWPVLVLKPLNVRGCKGWRPAKNGSQR